MKSRTADEKFLIALYKIASESGDPHSNVDYRKVLRYIAQKETAGKTIMKHLAQANFIKKFDDPIIALTVHGMKIALEIEAS